MRYFIYIFLIILTIGQIAAQPRQSFSIIRNIKFGNIPGYTTLKCDFHQHTVFSDGSVWPDIRVQEALHDSLDAISITDHLEYLPHKEDLPHPDRNRPYQLAVDRAKNHDIIIINACEITRDLPPGHANALFVKDVNKLLIDDPIEVFNAAKEQDAFVFWNHPSWTAQKEDGIAELADIHRKLIKEGLISGIELINEDTYSEEAFQIALDHNLTIIGSSDVHGLIDWKYNILEGEHRPLTLVFATGKSEEAVKEGLINRRTAVWFKGSLIGKSEFVVPLIHNALHLIEAKYRDKTTVARLRLENQTDVRYLLKNKSDFSFHKNTDIIYINPRSTTFIDVKTKDKLKEFELRFEVLNALIAPKTHPEISVKINIAEN
jgi:hypothetical protein